MRRSKPGKSHAAYLAGERNDKLRELLLTTGPRLEGSRRPAQRLDWAKIISEQFAAKDAEIVQQNAESHRRYIAQFSRPKGHSLVVH